MRCKERILTKVVNQKSKHKLNMSREKKLLTSIVNLSCKQKLWTIIMNKTVMNFSSEKVLKVLN